MRSGQGLRLGAGKLVVAMLAAIMLAGVPVALAKGDGRLLGGHGRVNVPVHLRRQFESHPRQRDGRLRETLAALRAFTRAHPGREVARLGGPTASGRELAALRTATSQTYVQTNGALLTQVFRDPVNFRDGSGRWATIDNRLVPARNRAYRNAANSYVATVPADLDQTPVRFAGDGAALTLSLRDARAPGRVHGSGEVFSGALPGVDVRYDATATTLHETLTLSGTQVPRTFSYVLTPSAGLTARQTRAGAIVIVDSSGRVRITLSPTTITDRTANDGVLHAVATKLKRQAGGSYLLRVAPETSWTQQRLRAGHRLVIDPDISLNASGADCTISGAAPSTPCGTPATDYVGYDGSTERHTLLKFNIQGCLPRDVEVLESELGVATTSATTASTATVGVYRVTRPWTTGATWSTSDGTTAWTTPGGDTASAPVETEPMSGAGAKVFFNQAGMASLVQGWLDGTTPNNGLELKDTQPAATNVIGIGSSNQSTSMAPYLHVLWKPRSGAFSNYKFDSQRLTDRMNLGVNLANGNLLLKNQDLEIPGTKLGLTFDRYWNSLDSDTNSMGLGWATNVGPDVHLYYDPDGRNMQLIGPSGYHKTFSADASYHWTGPAELGVDFNYGATSGTYTLYFHKTGITETFTGCGQGGCNAYLTQMKDRYGNKITYTYDNTQSSTAHLQSITDTQGRTLTVTTDASSGRITQLKDWTGRTWSYGYTGIDLTSYTDPTGAVTKYAYDAQNDVTQITTPAGRVVQIAYVNPAGGDYRVQSITRVTNTSTGAGDTTTYSYSSSPGAPCQSTDYNQTVVSDPRGTKTTYCFDPKDRATKVIDAKGNSRPTSFDGDGNVLSFQPNGGSAVSTGTYDSKDNLTAVTDPSQLKSTASYADTNHPYDATQAVDGSGSTQNFCYVGGSAGQTGCPSDGSGQPNGATKAILDKTGNALHTYSYNSNGTLAAETDANGSVTTYTYDASGNLTQVTPPTAQNTPGSVQMGATQYRPDGLSRVATKIDANGNGTQYTYDNLDRVVKIAYQDGSSITNTYDADGNLLGRADSGVTSTTGTTSYGYDGKGRLTSQKLPSGEQNTYAYDATNNLSSMTSPAGTMSYGYDQLNELSSLAEPGGTCSGTSTSLCSTFSYDNYGNRTKTNLANGDTVTSTWDPAGRMLSTGAKTAAGATLTSYAYTYAGGLMTTEKDKDGNTWSYTYDGLDRLLEGKQTNTSGGVANDYQYTYDREGNELTSTINGTLSSKVYNADNELCYSASGVASAGCAAPPTGATTYKYDANGNKTAGSDGVAYGYNARNQTTSITQQSTTTNQTYGGDGQSELASSGGLTFENSQLGALIQHGGKWGDADFFREPDGHLFSTLEAGRRHYYLFDAHSSVVGLANTDGSNGGLGLYQTYGPDGRGLSTPVQNVENYWWYAGGLTVGRRLYHFGERNLEVGPDRWTQPDSMSHLGDPQQHDPYVYVGDNPANFTDPAGLCIIFSCSTWHEGVAGAVSGAIGGAIAGSPGGPLSALGGAVTGAAVGLGQGLGGGLLREHGVPGRVVDTAETALGAGGIVRGFTRSIGRTLLRDAPRAGGW